MAVLVLAVEELGTVQLVIFALAVMAVTAS
jgi:hypothetical protein